MPKYANVDDYMSALPEDRRAVMEQLRHTIRTAAPDATEAIAYNMPAFRLGGRFFLSYEAFKRHYSLFPWTDAMVDELGDALKPYAVGKGTLRFRADEPIPLDLVTRIVAIRRREFDELRRATRRPPNRQPHEGRVRASLRYPGAMAVRQEARWCRADSARRCRADSARRSRWLIGPARWLR